MSAEAALLVRSWKVGDRKVTLSMPRPRRAGEPTHCVIEWDPAPPKRLTSTELEQYRAGRDEAIAEIAQTLELRVAVVEVG